MPASTTLSGEAPVGPRWFASNDEELLGWEMVVNDLDGDGIAEILVASPAAPPLRVRS